MATMNVLTVARFTIQEAISRKLVLAGVVLSLCFVGLFALGFAFLHGRAVDSIDSGRTRMTLALFSSTMTVLGLYAVNFLSGFLALFVSVGSISSEIDSGTLHAVLARPIHRAELVLGRWLAYCLLMSAYVALMVSLLLLVARLIAGYEAPSPLPAIGLMVLSAVLLLTLSLFGSTLFSTLANGVVVFSLFGLAWLAGIIEFFGAAIDNTAMINLGIFVSLLVPSDTIWRGASYYIQSPSVLAMMAAGRDVLPFASNAPPAAPMLLWALAYPVVLVVASIFTFSRRDL
ncbi:MAG: ABC transporter permease subunit [Chloroflexi bacterium]|nr:ABC transporter permease subunit [Chloroflexota bacterium]